MALLGYYLEDAASNSAGHRTVVHKAGVRSVLGTLGYHRAMVPKFAEITHSLTELLKSKTLR
jgi:hypothetical protein